METTLNQNVPKHDVVDKPTPPSEPSLDDSKAPLKIGDKVSLSGVIVSFDQKWKRFLVRMDVPLIEGQPFELTLYERNLKLEAK